MLKIILVALLPLLFLYSFGTSPSSIRPVEKSRSDNSGTLEKMIVAEGSVTLDLDLNRLRGRRQSSKATVSSQFRFDVDPASFFKVLVFNDELRGPLPSSMGLVPRDAAELPGKLNDSYGQLVLESLEWGGQYDVAIRDGKTGFTYFYLEGFDYGFDPASDQLTMSSGRILISREYAEDLGRPNESGTIVGNMSVSARLRPIEVTHLVDGEIKSDTLPADPLTGTVPGPDVVVGELSGLAQFGSSSGTQVGLAVGTDSCNFGTVDLNWFANPNNDHPVIPQNLYRMSGGASNTERFEQVGQSNVKHAFTALTNNICNLGCNGVGGSRLGSGCSDPYGASLNAGPSLGSRAWINPFTGFFPRNDSATPNNSHTGHSHTGTSHRILTEIADLNTSLNPGATYYAEGQYITPHEYAWCQSNPTQCNMYNNVSYRRYNVIGTGSPFSFSAAASTVRAKPAIDAWTGSTSVEIRPDPGNDGIAFVAYKVTNTSPGVWHYEYAVYNQNLDRAIQMFSIPIGGGVTLSNVGFHAPPQHPGWSADGTVGNAGFSSTPWAWSAGPGSVSWNTETFAQNPNANAIRWGTLYNFRFDSNSPPQTTNATVGFFKTGAPINVSVQGPAGSVVGVSVSGRVMTPMGEGLRNAYVSITDSSNNTRTVVTGSFGNYQFDNVVPGGMYTISVVRRRYAFTPVNMQVNNNVTDLNFVPIQMP